MNWKQAAVDRLTRYSAMQQARQTIPLELERLEAEAQALRSTFVAGNGAKTTRDRDSWIINNLVQRQELEWALQDAIRWLRVTNLALDTLPLTERSILEGLFFGQGKKPAQLEEELCLDRSTFYRYRDKALERFTLALYGTLDS